MTSEHNTIVKSEIEGMLKDRIIKPIESPLGFPAAIVTECDGHSRFCVEYCVLNSHMKSDRFPMSMINKILDGMSREKLFTKLNMFEGYWKIRSAENVI